jgi:hypothetical protein
MLASQVLRRPLRRLRPGGPARRSGEERDRAAEPAAVCWQFEEVCWMLEDRAPLLPVAFWALNLAERSGRPDLVMLNQAGMGNVLTAAGHPRLARAHVRAAVTAAELTSDPVTLVYTYILTCLHWIAVGDWPAADAGLPRVLEAGNRAQLHRMVDQAVLLAAVCRYLTGRFEEAAAMHHLATGRADDAWRSVRTAAALAGPEPSFHPYTIEAHAGIPEVCLALLERGGAPAADPAQLRATASVGLRRLERYSRTFPMARPRARLCLGAWQALEGRRRAAVRSWARAVEAAERLAMPWELAWGQLQLGRHLGPGERAPGGLDPDALLDLAAAGFAAMGCPAEAGSQLPAPDLTGLRLADGREVVVKARPPAARMAGGGPQLDRLAAEVAERVGRAGA